MKHPIKLILTLSLLLAGCQWELEGIEFVLVRTGQASRISGTSIEVTGTIVNLPSSGEITRYGHSWSVDPGFQGAQSNDLGTPNVEGDFLTLISGLFPNTIYYIRSYAVYDEKTFYGDIVAIATNELAVVTEEIQSVRGDSVKVLGSIFGLDGQTNIEGYGHCWSDLNQLPVLEDNYRDLGLRAKDGIFENTLTGLVPDRTYYVRSYAVVNGEPFYDPEAVVFATRDVWYQKKDIAPDLNDAPLFGVTSVVIDDQGYTLFGKKTVDDYTDECWKYDPRQDSWTLASHFSGELRQYAGGFVIGNTAYYGYGMRYKEGSATEFDAFFTDFWQFTPGEADEWKPMPDVPTIFLPYGFSIGNFGYLVGIYITENDEAENQVWSFRPGSGWRRLGNNFPGAVRWRPVVFSIGGKAYVGLGEALEGSVTSLKDFWEFDPVSGAWIRLPDFPGVARSDAVVFVMGTKAFIGGGTNILTQEIGAPDLWEFNPTNLNNPWTRRADLPSRARTSVIHFSIGNRGYVGGGGAGTTFWEYVPPE